MCYAMLAWIKSVTGVPEKRLKLPSGIQCIQINAVTYNTVKHPIIRKLIKHVRLQWKAQQNQSPVRPVPSPQRQAWLVRLAVCPVAAGSTAESQGSPLPAVKVT